MDTSKSRDMLFYLAQEGALQKFELVIKLNIDELHFNRIAGEMKQQNLIIETAPKLFVISSKGRDIIHYRGETGKLNVKNETERKIKKVQNEYADNKVKAAEERLRRLKIENKELKYENLKLKEEIQQNFINDNRSYKGSEERILPELKMKIAELEHKIEKLTYEKNFLIVECSDLSRDLLINKEMESEIYNIKTQEKIFLDELDKY